MNKSSFILFVILSFFSCSPEENAGKENLNQRVLRIDAKYVSNNIDELLYHSDEVPYLGLIYETLFSSELVKNNDVIDSYQIDSINKELILFISSESDELNPKIIENSILDFILYCKNNGVYKKLLVKNFDQFNFTSDIIKIEKIIGNYIERNDTTSSLRIKYSNNPNTLLNFLSKPELIIRKNCANNNSSLPCGTGKYEIIEGNTSSKLILRLKNPGRSDAYFYQQIEITNYSKSDFALRSFLKGDLDILMNSPLDRTNELMEGVYERNENHYGKFDIIDYDRKRCLWVLLSPEIEIKTRKEHLALIHKLLAKNSFLQETKLSFDIDSTISVGDIDSISKNMKFGFELNNEVLTSISKALKEFGFTNANSLNRKVLIDKFRKGEYDVVIFSSDNADLKNLLNSGFFSEWNSFETSSGSDSVLSDYNSNFAFYTSFEFEESPMLIQPYVKIIEQISVKSDIFKNTEFEEIETLKSSNL